MAFRIERSVKAGTIVFALCGDLDNEHTERLQGLLEKEKQGRILLDLEDVTFVGREGVELLAQLEAAGVGIVNAPEYVRRWIASEKVAAENRRCSSNASPTNDS